MSAPAAIVAAKILFPEPEKVGLENQKLDISSQDVGSNILDAISRGTTDGLKLAINVGVMLLVFTAFVSMLNYIFTDVIGPIGNFNDYIAGATGGQYEHFSIEFVLGLLFAPIAWLLGVPSSDIMVVGQLLGLKTTLNEFFAYAALEGVKGELSFRSVIIATYALCGFANFASIGIQIGGIGAIAPGQRQTLTELGVKSLIGGTIACFITGTIAGFLVVGV
jgi:CNT family concentrative nucleoside transporter